MGFWSMVLWSWGCRWGEGFCIDIGIESGFGRGIGTVDPLSTLEAMHDVTLFSSAPLKHPLAMTSVGGGPSLHGVVLG